MPKNQSLQGIILVALAAMLWGTTGTAQSFVAMDLSPYWVGTLRLAIAAVFFIVYVYAVLGTRKVIKNLLEIDLKKALQAGFFVAIYNISFFAGVKVTGVAIGTALAIGSAPIWAGILQIIVGAVPAKGWWFGTLLAVVGGVLLALSQGTDIRIDPIGVSFCLAAGFSYAAYAILNKQMVHDSHPAITTLVIFTLGAVFAIPMAWILAGNLHMNTSAWLVVGFLGLVATGLAYLLFSSGLRYISAASGVSLALIEPVTAFILAILVVGENPSHVAYLGMLILLTGLVFVIRSETKTN